MSCLPSTSMDLTSSGTLKAKYWNAKKYNNLNSRRGYLFMTKKDISFCLTMKSHIWSLPHTLLELHWHLKVSLWYTTLFFFSNSANNSAWLSLLSGRSNVPPINKTTYSLITLSFFYQSFYILYIVFYTNI